jgi:hypothetical protein
MIYSQEYRLGMPRDGVRLSGHNPCWLPYRVPYRAG